MTNGPSSKTEQRSNGNRMRQNTRRQFLTLNHDPARGATARSGTAAKIRLLRGQFGRDPLAQVVSETVREARRGNSWRLGGVSIKIMSDVWKHSKRKDGELLVMLALADFSNDQGESWPSLKNLAQKARLSKEQLCKVLKKLERAGEIQRDRSTGGYNRRTRYFIDL